MTAYDGAAKRLVLMCIGLFVLLALLGDGLMPTLEGFIRLQSHAARLINDYTVIGGSGGALLNAAVMGLLALILVLASGVRLSGPTMAGIFTIMGFSLFGKTPVNSVPIVLGVFIASRIARKPFKNYLLMALFGTALGPIVSFIFFESGLSGIPAIVTGIAAGVLSGIVLPALGMAMLRMHEGFNLYNIGFTCGFFGLFAAAVLAGSNRDIAITVIWNSEARAELMLLTPLVSALFIAEGLIQDGRNIFKNLRRIMNLSGRLPSDFMDLVSPGAALVNAGLLGLAGSLYLFLIHADINGPVIGGLLTVIGFATFGKHAKNCWPVALGVIAATLVFGKSLTAPGPVLGLLFGTTLAPLAGEFGPFVGIAAGFVHLLMVERTAAFHGGLDLYNNGFAGGLTATLFVAIIQWVRSFKERKDE